MKILTVIIIDNIYEAQDWDYQDNWLPSLHEDSFLDDYCWKWQSLENEKERLWIPETLRNIIRTAYKNADDSGYLGQIKRALTKSDFRIMKNGCYENRGSNILIPDSFRVITLFHQHISLFGYDKLYS